jgi:hypothetical protein
VQRHRNEWRAVHGLYASVFLGVVYEHARMSLDEERSPQGVLTRRSRLRDHETLHHTLTLWSYKLGRYFLPRLLGALDIDDHPARRCLLVADSGRADWG